MAKSKRDPAAEVAASESPLLRRMQQTTPPPPPAEDKTSPSTKTTRKRVIPKPKVRASADVPKRCLVTRDEADLQDAMAKTLGRQVETVVQWSAITRAMWSLLLESDEVIDRVPAPTLKRPSNGKPEEMAEYEAELAAYLLDILRASKRR